jgi:hypothetical protein
MSGRIYTFSSLFSEWMPFQNFWFREREFEYLDDVIRGAAPVPEALPRLPPLPVGDPSHQAPHHHHQHEVLHLSLKKTGKRERERQTQLRLTINSINKVTIK